MESEHSPHPINLVLLEEDLRRPCQALWRLSKTIQMGKKPFQDDAIPRLVAFLWERPGQPRHAIVDKLPGRILGPEYGHIDWVRWHWDMEEWHRRKTRQFGFPIPHGFSQTPTN